MKSKRHLLPAQMSLLVSTAALAQGAPATAPAVPPSQRLKTSHGMQNDQVSPTPAAPGGNHHPKKQKTTKPRLGRPALSANSHAGSPVERGPRKSSAEALPG